MFSNKSNKKASVEIVEESLPFDPEKRVLLRAVCACGQRSVGHAVRPKERAASMREIKAWIKAHARRPCA